MKCLKALLWCGPFLLLAAETTPVCAQTVYRKPPPIVSGVLDRGPLPEVHVGPRRQNLLIIRRAGMPGIAELSLPRVHLAGKRFNPQNRGPIPHRQGRIVELRLRSIEDGLERQVELPEDANLDSPLWSPDGRRIAFVNLRTTGAELWIADLTKDEVKRVTDPILNPASGPCHWFPDSLHLLCPFRPSDLGARPVRPGVPGGATVQESSGEKAPARTYQDLLSNQQDILDYEYLLRSQQTVVSAKNGRRREVGSPGLFARTSISPSGQFILVERIVPPYSFLVPERDFPREVEVWSRTGQLMTTLATLPLAETIPIGGVRTGPRSIDWKPVEPATLVWREALDGGDPRREVTQRDRLVELAFPFRDEPRELMRSEWRLTSLRWMPDGGALVSEFDRESQRVRTWLLPAANEETAAAARLLWERGRYDAYHDPGSFVSVSDDAGNPLVLRTGDDVFLDGRGSSPDGDHPFLRRLNLDTMESTELFRSGEGVYEEVVTIVDPESPVLLTRRETAEDPPEYWVRDLSGAAPRRLMSLADPAPEFRGVVKELITYWREDGVELSGTLYLPAGHREGETLPLVMWAYPREYNDPEIASQVRGSSDRFTRPSGASPLFFLTQGYAVLDGPSMPIVGKDGNDTFVEQLVMNARAAIDKVVAMGVADPRRIGIGGHSYGAFMAANLLAHSDLFAAGIARSGAYNRTLTPFGFQNERRTFWEAPEVYFTLSPFMHADRINEPILLIHGEDDNNSGTFPIQSKRLFHAIQGLGGTARLVLLPKESHGYVARESVLDTLAEMIDWFDRYVKHRPEHPPEPDD